MNYPDYLSSGHLDYSLNKINFTALNLAWPAMCMKVYLIEGRVEVEHRPKHTFQFFDAVNLCRRAMLRVGMLFRVAP